MKEFTYQRFWLRMFASVPIAVVIAAIVGVLLYFFAPSVSGYSLITICVILVVLTFFLSYPVCRRMFIRTGTYKYSDGRLEIHMGKKTLDTDIRDIVGIECGRVRLNGERCMGLFIRTKDKPKKVFKVLSPKIKKNEFNINTHEYMAVVKKVTNFNPLLKQVKDSRMRYRLIYVVK